ncbi:unnamed protein product [Spirodela intermedia]|uniref:Uncharacterized protein n=2 Tax=Spirodela intermedia TaxID=51605 RepID=A0A7I8JP27_SPIIN|nr:unnamed protein product [Spirodela intermedia]CAA6671521.1 unnamed protein product [Spirodela intermedia]CAA7408622.1 unnamed protein product [Spirodela intermedia]
MLNLKLQNYYYYY